MATFTSSVSYSIDGNTIDLADNDFRMIEQNGILNQWSLIDLTDLYPSANFTFGFELTATEDPSSTVIPFILSFYDTETRLRFNFNTNATETAFSVVMENTVNNTLQTYTLYTGTKPSYYPATNTKILIRILNGFLWVKVGSTFWLEKYDIEGHPLHLEGGIIQFSLTNTSVLVSHRIKNIYLEPILNIADQTYFQKSIFAERIEGLDIGDVEPFTYLGSNVGIGVASPTQKLDVAGNINLTGDIYKNGVVWNPSPNVYFVDDSLSNDYEVLLGDGATYNKMAIRAGQSIFLTPILNTVTEAQEMLIEAETFNGGTITNDLTVGDMLGDGYIRLWTPALDGGYYSYITIGGGNAGICQWFKNDATRTLDGGARTATIRNDDGNLRLQSRLGNGGIFIQEDSGNVGIGTATPTKQLHVQGDINFTGDVYKNGALWSSTFNGGIVPNTIQVGNANGYSIVATPVNNGGVYHTYMAIGGGNAGYCYWFKNDASRTVDGGARTATLRNDDGALRLQSNGGGIIISGGNVGVSLSTPIRAFHMVGEYSITPSSENGNTAFINIHDTNGNSGWSYNLAIRGLGSSGTAHVNLNHCYIYANGTTAVGEMYCNGWFRNNGSDTGLVNQVLGTGIFFPLNGMTYGSVRTYGARNGWAGFNSENQIALMTNSENGGLYHIGRGSWLLYSEPAASHQVLYRTTDSRTQMLIRSDANQYSVMWQVNSQYSSFYNNGGVWANIGMGFNAAGFFGYSDKRCKANICDSCCHNDLDKIMSLKAKRYNMKKDRVKEVIKKKRPKKENPDEEEEYDEYIHEQYVDEKEVHTGFIAQEIEEVYPELVDSSGKVKTLNYMGLIAPLINAFQGYVKKTDDRIKALEEQLAAHQNHSSKVGNELK